MGVLQEKVVIVSGAVDSVGASVCAAVARMGARVAIVDMNEFAAAALAAKLESAGAQAIAIGCDTRDGDDITRVVHTTVDWFGTVDILVNNVHRGIRDFALEDMTDTDFDLALAASATTLRFMRACHPHLVGGGHVVNLKRGTEVTDVADAVAQEWVWRGITVHSLPAENLNALEGLVTGQSADRRGIAGQVAVFPVGPHRSSADRALAG